MVDVSITEISEPEGDNLSDLEGLENALFPKPSALTSAARVEAVLRATERGPLPSEYREFNKKRKKERDDGDAMPKKKKRRRKRVDGGAMPKKRIREKSKDGDAAPKKKKKKKRKDGDAVPKKKKVKATKDGDAKPKKEKKKGGGVKSIEAIDPGTTIVNQYTDKYNKAGGGDAAVWEKRVHSCAWHMEMARKERGGSSKADAKLAARTFANRVVGEWCKAVGV